MFFISLGKCPNRPPPEHGSYISRQRTKTVWDVNEEAIFICVTGYQLSGVSRSRCLKSGSWSSDLPVCRCKIRERCGEILTLFSNKFSVSSKDFYKEKNSL